MTTVSVLTGPERRRRWTSGEKLRIVNDCETSGLSVAEFARQRDIHANLLHLWRRQARMGGLSGASPGEVRFAPVTVVAGTDLQAAFPSGAKDLAVIEVPLHEMYRPEAGEQEELAHRLWCLERASQRARLSRLGVPVVEWHEGLPLAALMEEVGAFRRRGRQRAG